jgi:protein-S-isoprenylcysteine O-methyltransferase Ste14
LKWPRRDLNSERLRKKMKFMKTDRDSAHVRIPPPIIVLLNVFLGILLNWIWPIQIIEGKIGWVLGPILISVGVGTMIFCSRAFRKAKTNVEPWKTTRRIVTTGIYKYSRNPIYLSFIVIGLGIAFALDNLWIVLAQLSTIGFLQKYVISKEERYLESKFGEEYLNYRRKVRRWI